MAKAYQVWLSGHFFEGHSKSFQNMLIMVPFWQFLEGKSKNLKNVLIRKPIGQFLEGYGKILDTLLGHLLDSLWKGIARANKICSSGHFWAVFGKA